MSKLIKSTKNKSIISFNLQKNVIDFINKNANKLKLSKGDYICYLVENFINLREENQYLKFYLDNIQNENYIKSEIIESEIDFLTESKYGTYDN